MLRRMPSLIHLFFSAGYRILEEYPWRNLFPFEQKSSFIYVYYLLCKKLAQEKKLQQLLESREGARAV